MTGVPPFAAPSYHIKPTYVPEVTSGSFAKFRGISGFVKIVAPLPSSEVSEAPRTFEAITVA